MSVILTDAAAERVKTFMQSHTEAIGLRVAVKVVGCSGFAYVVNLADSINDGDRVFQSNGVQVVVDAKSLPVVDGTEIDFSRQGLNEGFEYRNPNARNMCGCGESFGV